MKALTLTLGCLSLLCGGCTSNCRDTSLYQYSGRQKPIVAVLPVLTSAKESHLPWSLSRELTDEIRKRVYESKKIYLLRENSSVELAKLLSTPNPQALPKKVSGLGEAQFAVVTEVIEREDQLGCTDPQSAEISSLLSLALRVRVMDMRQGEPKVILQEVLDNDFMVARAYMNYDYSKTPWGKEGFACTPMGMSHNRLIRTLVSRIEAYIEAVQ